LALAFLLGVGVALLSTRLIQGRFTRPLEPMPAAFRLDVNNASIDELRQLPRVGSSLADRLVDSRPFADVNDLRRVPGVGPSTFQKIQPYVTTGMATTSTKRHSDSLIDPNTATLEELQTLPGIGPKMAQRIIAERERKPFVAIEDMRRVSGIGPKTIEKLRDHVLFNYEK